MGETRPNRVRWEDLDRGTFEDMVATLISRRYPSAQRIDGSGGDGGRDLQMYTDEGLVVFQLKGVTGRMDPRRRRQVERSLMRAAQDDPIRWCLVVPIDHTPGELDWFNRINDGYGFDCCWRGKTWLDGEMARNPDIVRYFAHGQRFELSEFVGLFEALGAEPPTLRNGVVGEAAWRINNIAQAINRLDPHYEFGFTTQPDDVSMTLTVLEQGQTILARLPLETVAVTAGTHGGRVQLRDKSGAFTARATFDIHNMRFDLTWAYTPPEVYTPLDLLPAVKFLAALATGDYLTVDFNGATLGPESVYAFGEAAEEAVRFTRVLEHLVRVQVKTGMFFDVVGDLTTDVADSIIVASRLLRGEQVEGTWEAVTLTIPPEGKTAVEEALGGLNAIPNTQIGANMSIRIQDTEVPIGWVVRVLESATVHAWEQANDDDHPGMTKLYLIPADADKVTQSLKATAS
ncbi:MAG: hypothetical protein OXS29_15625 [bacterium]|nr:hypothetical protein [bacterium]MDE0439328.1 hypothetical protein [bacterium]